MAKKTLIILAWMMALFISPEALALQGNLAGMNGFGFVWLLAAAALLHGLNVAVLQRAGSDGTPVSEIAHLKDVYGPVTASLLLLMARPALAICLATAVLVTSGFVFNEVFLYWFPNFGFAAVVLVLVLSVNLAGPIPAAYAQVVAMAAAVAGIATIVSVGLFAGGQTPLAAPGAFTIATGLQGLGLAAIVLLGYDMLRYTDQGGDSLQMAVFMKAGLITGAALLTLWNVTALLNVAPARLADTSIPHVLVARGVMGQAGRLIIGVVAIAGAFAAVNYLFQTVSRMTVHMANHNLLPAAFARTEARPIFALCGLAVIIGLLMATGFAGSDWVDIGIRSSLVLWLVFYAFAQLAWLRRERPLSRQKHQANAGGWRGLSLSVAVAMTSLAVILVATDDAPGDLLTAIAFTLILAAGLALSGRVAARGMFSGTRFVLRQTEKGENP